MVVKGMDVSSIKVWDECFMQCMQVPSILTLHMCLCILKKSGVGSQLSQPLKCLKIWVAKI